MDPVAPPSRARSFAAHLCLTIAGATSWICSADLTAQTPPTAPPEAAAKPHDLARPPQLRLPEVVITESGHDPRALDGTPIDNTASRDVISPQVVREYGVMNVQEVLRRSPGIMVSDETGSDSLPNIAVRGLTGTEGVFRSLNLTMLADGIPLAPAPYGHPGSSLFPLPLERIHAIDIQRGGYSVRYGPNTVSGVINLLTRPIPERTTLEVRGRYDSYHNSSLYTGVGGQFGRFGTLVEAVYKDGDTYRSNGDYTIQNYSSKSSFAFTESLRAMVQFEYFDDDSRIADGLTLAAFQQDPRQTLAAQNRFNGRQGRANLKLEWDIDAATRAELVTYVYDGQRTFYLGSPNFYGQTPNFIQATPRPMRVWAVQPQVTHRNDLFGADNELTFGVRYLQEDIVRTTRRDNPNGTRTITAEAQFDYYTGSAFIENIWRNGDLTVTPGVRFEYVEMDARDRLTGFGVDRSFSEILPALSASYMLAEDWSVYGNVQSSFAAPQAVQIEISNDPQDISAQYAWVYELGMRTDWWDGLCKSDLTLYHIDYSDRLEPDPDQFDVFLNSGRSRHRGVELKLEANLGKAADALSGLSLWANGSYNDSEYTNGDFNGNTLPGAPGWLAAWGARYEFGRTGFWGAVDGFYVAKAFSDRENTEAINANGTRGIRPSYTVWNARLGWQKEIVEGTTMQTQFAVRNVFDEEYFEVRSGRGLLLGAPFVYGAEIAVIHRF
jgi:Fe(3+) dicitrate transport protein